MTETTQHTHTDHICPTCSGYVGIQEDGALFPHKRYADGAGYGPDQPHTLIPCEGGAPVTPGSGSEEESNA